MTPSIEAENQLSYYGSILMVTSFDISQEIFSIDMLTALKSSLKHRRKHVLRSFRLYGDQA